MAFSNTLFSLTWVLLKRDTPVLILNIIKIHLPENAVLIYLTGMQKDKQQVKIVATNRKAHHLYHILESYEAGIALVGTEVKSLRLGRANLKDSYGMVKQGEVYLHNMHISPYDQASRFNHDPTRTRKLLLHRREIKRLLGKTVEKGLTLVPLKFYFKGKVAKVELALAVGKKIYDRRKDIKDREVKRELRRALKEKQR
jgi:SsrA-binding protein